MQRSNTAFLMCVHAFCGNTGAMKWLCALRRPSVQKTRSSAFPPAPRPLSHSSARAPFTRSVPPSHSLRNPLQDRAQAPPAQQQHALQCSAVHAKTTATALAPLQPPHGPLLGVCPSITTRACVHFRSDQRHHTTPQAAASRPSTTATPPPRNVRACSGAVAAGRRGRTGGTSEAQTLNPKTLACLQNPKSPSSGSPLPRPPSAAAPSGPPGKRPAHTTQRWQRGGRGRGQKAGRGGHKGTSDKER